MLSEQCLDLLAACVPSCLVYMTAHVLIQTLLGLLERTDTSEKPSLIAWHTGCMKLLSWQSWSLEIKDVGRFTSRICNTGRMKLKFQVFVKLVSCQSKRTAQCAPVRNKIVLIYTYWTLITVVHSYLNSLQYTKEQQ